MSLNRKVEAEFINVHRVFGPKDVILFLKNAEHEYMEGLFYHAKHDRRVEFYFQSAKYEMVRNDDESFTIRLAEDQELTAESLT